MNSVYRFPVWRAVFFLFAFTLTIATANFSTLFADDPAVSEGYAIVQLRKGGQVEGRVVPQGEGRPKHYLVYTDNGGILKLKATEVRRVSYYEPEELAYFARRKSMPNTVEAHWNEAERLTDIKMRKYRDYHLYQILQLDPEHPDARAKLGYRKYEGYGDRWFTVEGFHVMNGYQKVGNSWVLPQERIFLEAERAAKKEAADLRNEIDRLRRLIPRNGDQELKDYLRGLKQPRAVQALADLIDAEDEKRRNWNDKQEIQMLYIDTIGQIEGGTAIGQLVKLSIVGPSQDIREHSLLQLKKDHYDRKQVVNALVPFLNQNLGNEVVERAGFALGEMGDESAIRPLISALETRHQVQAAGNPGQMQFGQSNTGGGGLQVGGDKSAKFANVKNPNVHAALRRCVKSNVDFGYDKLAWMQWYISQQTITNIDLRRDE
jgi:hypothetical protein